MSPNKTGRTLRTAEDAEAEKNIIESWYAGFTITALATSKFAAADWLVIGENLRDLVECKDRRHYTLRYMRERGYDVSADKLRRLVNRANAEHARPVLLVGVVDAVFEIDPRLALAKARRKTIERQRGAERRGDLPEPGVNIWPHLWGEIRDRINGIISEPTRCYTCGAFPVGVFPDGSARFRCHIDRPDIHIPTSDPRWKQVWERG